MSSPAWPTFYGTMLLIAMDAPLSELEDLERELNAALKSHDAAFARGLEAVPVDVRPGLLARTWLEPARVFVMRCPSGRTENQTCIAAIAKGEQRHPELQSIAIRLIEAATLIALQQSAHVVWVVADEWHVDDAVAFQNGHVGEFVEYVGSSYAWTTWTVTRGKSYIVTSNNELPFWYEVRSSTRTLLDASVLEQARGKRVQVSRYDCSLQRIAILLQLEQGYAYLVASGCLSMRGPFRWDDCQLTIATHDGRTVMRDIGADFELIFQGTHAFVDTVGQPFDGAALRCVSIR